MNQEIGDAVRRIEPRQLLGLPACNSGICLKRLKAANVMRPIFETGEKTRIWKGGVRGPQKSPYNS
jgi:hypothetical protein